MRMALQMTWPKKTFSLLKRLRQNSLATVNAMARFAQAGVSKEVMKSMYVEGEQELSNLEHCDAGNEPQPKSPT